MALILNGYAELAGDALPHSLLMNPGIGEPTLMFEGFAMVCSLLVKCTEHDRGISMNMDRHIVSHQEFQVSIGISSKSYFLCLVDNTSIGFRHHKIVGHESAKSG